jgi:hypothetical protein
VLVYFVAGVSKAPPVNKLLVCILFDPSGSLTKQWADEEPYVARKRPIAEGPRLSMLRAVFAKHSPNSNDGSSEYARKTSSNYHLP